MKLGSTLLTAICLWGACGADDAQSSPDATAPDAAVVDAAGLDALPDAMSRCGSDFLLEGEFVDWNSTPAPEDFKGIFDATVVEIGNETNTMSTPPNGRVNLCITPAADTELRYSHSNYRTIHHSVSGQAAPQGDFSVRSLTSAQETQFQTDTGVAIADASLLVEVREYPSMAPVIGATVTFAGTAAGVFTQDATRAWVSGNTTTHHAHVFMPGIASTGSVAVTVNPPVGTTCVGRSTVTLVSGEITFTRFACTR